MAEAADDRTLEVLTEAMETRRDELGKTWRQIANDGGISYETVRAVRKGTGKGPIPSPTRRALERGLEWPTRHIDNLIILCADHHAAVVEHATPEPADVEPDLRDDVERDLWQLATTRGLGEHGAWLLINAYRSDREQSDKPHTLGERDTG